MEANDPQMAQRRAEEYEKSVGAPDVAMLAARSRTGEFYQSLNNLARYGYGASRSSEE